MYTHQLASPCLATARSLVSDPLLQRAMRGDVEAAQALMLQILPRLRRVVRRLVRDDEIGDYCQEASLRILEALPGYRGEGRFEAWVDAITARVTLRCLVKRRADLQRLRETPGFPLDLPHTNSTVHHALALGRALEGLAGLTEHQRVAFVMHHLLGMTVPEMSSELSVPIETIRSRLRAGMGQLRAELGLV